MKYSIEQLLESYSKANSIKSTWDSQYRDIFEYCMPARDGYQKAVQGEKIDQNFQDRRERLFSSLGEQSANEFVNTMQEVLCPPMSKWISVEAGRAFKEEDRGKINEQLDKLCELANEYKNNSYFDLAFTEFCFDVFAGTGCMLVLPGTPLNPIVFKAIPLREYCLEEGANGEVCKVFRAYSLRRELLSTQWKEVKKQKLTEEQAKKDANLIECTYYDNDLYIYHYVVIDRDTKEELVHREHQTNPFVVLRWNKCAGEPYGRGVGMTALNDIKTLNLIKEYSLRNFAFNIPPLLVQEDAMLDVESLTLTPFSLNVVPNTQTSIVPLQISTDHNIESYKVQDLTMEIKRNTYGNTLPNEGNRQITATEINQRTSELRRSLSSVFGRLIAEFQIPLVRRIFDILVDTKIVKEQFEVKSIDGITFRVNINTPISRQLQSGEAQSIMAAVGTLLQIDPTGQTASSLLKLNEIGVHMMKLLGVPVRFINSLEQVETKQSQQAQQQAALQQGAIQADVDAANAKELGKAEAQVLKEGALQ